MIRWAITNLIMIFLRDHYVAQIFVLLVVSAIFQILLIASKPMTRKCDQRMAVLIEASVSIYLYSLLSLTDFTGENMLRTELGWVLAMLTAIVIGINVILFIWKILCRAVIFVKKNLPSYTVQEIRTVAIKPDDGNLSLHKSDNSTFIVNE